MSMLNDRDGPASSCRLLTRERASNPASLRESRCNHLQQHHSYRMQDAAILFRCGTISSNCTDCSQCFQNLRPVVDFAANTVAKRTAQRAQWQSAQLQNCKTFPTSSQTQSTQYDSPRDWSGRLRCHLPNANEKFSISSIQCTHKTTDHAVRVAARFGHASQEIL